MAASKMAEKRFTICSNHFGLAGPLGGTTSTKTPLSRVIGSTVRLRTLGSGATLSPSGPTGMQGLCSVGRFLIDSVELWLYGLNNSISFM